MDTRELRRQLGNRLKLLRTARGMRQEDLEDRGFSYRYYGRLERGLVNPTLETLVRLSDIFQVPLADLLGFLDQAVDGSENREAVVLKVEEVLRGDQERLRKLRVFLEEIL
jgi:transcriptional regulator with XRE-family HTH domain